MAARHLLLLLLAATAAAAVAASRGPGPNGGYHPPGTCGSLEAFLRTGPKFDFVAERLHKLPRRDFTLLLPLTSVPTGSWLRPGLPRSIVNDLVRNLVLTRNYRSVEELLEAGSARTLAGTQVTFAFEDGRVIATFEGLAEARGVVLPLPRSFKKVTVFSVGNDQLGSAPGNTTSAGRRLTACGCQGAYCTARIPCCGTCVNMSTDRYGLQSGTCQATSGANGSAC